MAAVAFVPAGMSFVDFKGEDIIITFVIVAHFTGFGRLCDRRGQSRRSLIGSFMAIAAPLPPAGRMVFVNFLPAVLFTCHMTMRFTCLMTMTEPALTHTGSFYQLPSPVIKIRHGLPVILQDRIGMTQAAVKFPLGVLFMKLSFFAGALLLTMAHNAAVAFGGSLQVPGFLYIRVVTLETRPLKSAQLSKVAVKASKPPVDRFRIE